MSTSPSHADKHIATETQPQFNIPPPVQYLDGETNTVRIRCRGITGDCDKEFGTTSNFNEHWQAVHSGVRYACLHCDVKSTWLKNIRKHVRTAHAGRCIQCDQEGAKKRKKEEGDKKRKKEAPPVSSGSPGPGQNTQPSAIEVAYYQIQQAMQQAMQQMNQRISGLEGEVLRLKKEVEDLTEFKKQFDSPLPPVFGSSHSLSLNDPNMPSLSSIGTMPSSNYTDYFGMPHPDAFRGIPEHERDLKRGPHPGPGPGGDIHSSDGVRNVPGGDGISVSGDDATVSGDDATVSGAGVTVSGGVNVSGDGVGADPDKTNSEDDRSSVSDSTEMGSGSDGVEVKTAKFSTSQNARFQQQVTLHLKKIYHDMSRISEKQKKLEFAGTQNKFDKSVLATYSNDQFYDFVENVANLRGEFLEKLRKASLTTSDLINGPEKCLENIYRKSSKRSRKILCKKLREKFPDELPELP